MKKLSNLLFGSFVLVMFFVFTSRAQDIEKQYEELIKNAPEKIEPITAPFDMPQLKRPVFPNKTFNIKDYGAVEGGTVKNTDAIKKTIAAAEKAGGGKVVIPAGKWLTGAIHLDNNINLYLEGLI